MSDVILLDKEFKDLNTEGMMQSLVTGAGKYLYFRDLGHGYRVVKKLTGHDNQEAYVKVPKMLFIESGFFRETLAKDGVTQTVVNNFVNQIKKESKMEITNKEALSNENAAPVETAEVVTPVEQAQTALPIISDDSDELLGCSRNRMIAVGGVAALVTSVAQSLLGGAGGVRTGANAVVSTLGGAAVGYVTDKAFEGAPAYLTALGLGSAVGSMVTMGSNVFFPKAKEVEEQEWTGEMDYSMMPVQPELPAV